MHITPKKWRKFAIIYVLVVFVLVFGIGLIFEEIGDTLVIGAMLISAPLTGISYVLCRSCPSCRRILPHVLPGCDYCPFCGERID